MSDVEKFLFANSDGKWTPQLSITNLYYTIHNTIKENGDVKLLVETDTTFLPMGR